MDNFEKHIRKNAHRFDGHQPDAEKMWANIAEGLRDDKVHKVTFWKSPFLRIAASVLILLGIASAVAITKVTRDTDVQESYAANELTDIDQHYRGLVAYQVRLVKDHPKLSEEEKKEFLSFMDELDREYEDLRSEMRKELNNKLLLEAIIANYKKRIELIENLLEQINGKEIKNENYEYTL